MQVVLLAGGLGTRLAEETDTRPKPMVNIGPIPILHHIINYFVKFNHSHFLIAGGYKVEMISEYFSNYADTFGPLVTIKVIDTGLETATGGRLLRLRPHLDSEFLMTYGDGLSNVDLGKVVSYHRTHQRLATVTAVRPPARFGTIRIQNGVVTSFSEKDPQDVGWINGGFFCLNSKVLDYIPSFETSFEGLPLKTLVEAEELRAFEHEGWWHPMDTLRDKRELEKLWETDRAPWLV